MSRAEPMYGGIKLNAAITSDNHLDINAKTNKERIRIIRKTLKDVQNSKAPFDAYITVGDMTSRGLTENWEYVKKCFEGRNPAKNILFALGNHDSWSKDGYKGYSDGIKNYYKYRKELCSVDGDTPYFSRVINGYHFIFLGSTEVPFDEDCASFNEAEIEWLKSELDSADNSDRPIFIFCHQSINNHHGLPRTWEEKEQDWPADVGGIGKDSDKVKEIISSHKNVFYFSGHSHMGLCGEKSAEKNGYASFENHDGVNYINLPCLTRPNHHGETEEPGWGCLLEVYGDRVLIRPRNFRKKKMNRKIAIQNGKPYLEIKL